MSYEKLKARCEHAKKEQLFVGMDADEMLALLASHAALLEALKDAHDCFLLDHHHNHPTAKRWAAAIAQAEQEP